MTPSDSDGGRSAGPPSARFDVDAVTAAARRADPGLPAETAQLLAADAGRALQRDPTADGPAVARALLVDHPQAGATACNMVATAALNFLAGQGEEPS